MERELEEQKQKLLRSEQSLQAAQTKEQDLRKKMEVGLNSLFVALLVSVLCCSLQILDISASLQELQKEKNCVTVQLDRSTRSVSQLEEEKRSSEQKLRSTQGLLEDLKGASLLSAGTTHLFLMLVSLYKLTVSFLYFSQIRRTGGGAEEASVKAGAAGSDISKGAGKHEENNF